MVETVNVVEAKEMIESRLGDDLILIDVRKSYGIQTGTYQRFKIIAVG